MNLSNDFDKLLKTIVEARAKAYMEKEIKWLEENSDLGVLKQNLDTVYNQFKRRFDEAESDFKDILKEAKGKLNSLEFQIDEIKQLLKNKALRKDLKVLIKNKTKKSTLKKKT